MALLAIRTSVSLFLVSLAGLANAGCLCCNNNETEAIEGFCKWWSEKHAQVEKLGFEVTGNLATSKARRLYIAYFRTHARLEDRYMWDLFRECPHFKASKHERLLRGNEDEEDDIASGLRAMANESMHGEAAAEGSNEQWAEFRVKVEAHMLSEEQVLKASGLLQSCEEHMQRRWTEVMESNQQDAMILYEEFRKMDLGLLQILSFVRGMVEEWSLFPELRRRTALRMHQVRQRMPELLDDAAFKDVLSQASLPVVAEYFRWIQLEHTEGIGIHLTEEISLGFCLLSRFIFTYFQQIAAALLFVGFTAWASRQVYGKVFLYETSTSDTPAMLRSKDGVMMSPPRMPARPHASPSRD